MLMIRVDTDWLEVPRKSREHWGHNLRHQILSHVKVSENQCVEAENRNT